MIISMTAPLAGALAALVAGAALQTPQEPQQETQARTHEFRFEPPVGMALATTVTESHDLLLVELETRRGDEAPRDADAALRLRSRADVLFADERDGETGRIRRRYVDIAGSIQLVDPESFNEETGEWNGSEFKITSRLAGISVAFQPAENQPGGFGRHFDAKALREPILPLLAPPVDWSTFFPPKGEDGVARGALGDSWSLAPELLQPLLAPTGFLGWRGGEGADPQILRAHASGVGGNLHLGFEGGATGTATATIKQIGGDPSLGRYAEIELAYDIVVQADRTDFADEQRLEREGDEGIEMLGATLRVHLKGGATIRWAFELGRPTAVFVAADESVTMSVRVLPPDGEAVEQSMRMVGALVNGLKFREMPLAPVTRREGR